MTHRHPCGAEAPTRLRVVPDEALVDLHVVEAVDHTTVDAVLVRHRDGSIGHMSFETAIAAGIAARAQLEANALAQIDPKTTGAAVLP